jgi:hypothetical protein
VLAFRNITLDQSIDPADPAYIAIEFVSGFRNIIDAYRVPLLPRSEASCNATRWETFRGRSVTPAAKAGVTSPTTRNRYLSALSLII